MELKDRLRAGEVVLGTWLGLGSAVTAEICGRAGFDWVLLDLEHGAGSEAVLLSQLQAVAATAATPIVRVEANYRPRFARVLDMGAGGVMVPRIEGVDDARAAVAHLRYPPAGVRGVATANRAWNYAVQPPESLGQMNDRIVGVLQIESEAAVAAARDIAAVDGVDVLFVGPSDLSAAMGLFGQTGHARFLQAVDTVAEAAAGAGKAAGVLAGSVEAAEPYLQRGYTFVALGSDTAMLAGAAAATLQAARDRIERA